MNVQYRAVQPLDVLNFRGNKNFGEAGEHGESQMPPQPSIFAGALRSYWLAEQKVDLHHLAKAGSLPNAQLNTQLGTPNKPGSFRVQHLCLAKIGRAEVEDLYIPIPADVLVLKTATHVLQPLLMPKGISTSGLLPQQAALKAKAEKPESGKWLNKAGLTAYMQGQPLNEDNHIVSSNYLYTTDQRLGIALEAKTRTADEGKIYTTESIALKDSIGFLVAITGAQDYPINGNLRLGGDGRGAAMLACEAHLPSPDWKKIETQKRFKIILTTPALFSEGWHWGQAPTPTKMQVTIGNGTATLVSAAMNRFGVISGWDLAKWHPKDAQRITPAGSVYWLENYTGDIASLQQQLQDGIVVDTLDKSRRAEGYNNFMIANWT